MFEGGGGGCGGGQPPSDTPRKLTLPQLFLTAVGPGFPATGKAALVPWSARAIQEGCARDQPLFAGVSHVYMALECVICRQGEYKGTWRQEVSEGAAWTWRPLPGELLSPIPEGNGVG